MSYKQIEKNKPPLGGKRILNNANALMLRAKEARMPYYKEPVASSTTNKRNIEKFCDY